MEGVKTVSEIAKDLGTNRQKIWRIVRALDIKERFKDGNRAVILDEDVTRIRAEFLRIHEKAQSVHSDRRTDNAEKDTASRSDTAAAVEVAVLEAQLKGKDELLAVKDEIIADLKQRLDTMQHNYDELNTRFAETQKQSSAQLIAMARPKLLERIKEVFKPSGAIY